MSRPIVIAAVLLLQAVCGLFLLSDILVSVFAIPIPPLNWTIYEFVELGATAGLILGVVLSGFMIRQSTGRARRAETALRVASGAFMEVLEQRFDEWALTPAERDVALFAMKGMSTAEIARLRATSEGTVKAQTNAIYRKAGVNGRPQLMSLFIDDLLAPVEEKG